MVSSDSFTCMTLICQQKCGFLPVCIIYSANFHDFLHFFPTFCRYYVLYICAISVFMCILINLVPNVAFNEILIY